MRVFKENKVLMIWGTIAVVIVLFDFCFRPIGSNKSKLLPDTIIHFTFDQTQKHKLDSLFILKHKYGGFNGVVLVGQKDSIFFQKSYGLSNRLTKDSLTVNHAFQLASVSKQFTGLSILQLYENGLLNLNDTVQKFYPDFPYKNITIHQLLVHRSGLPNYHYFLQHIPTTYDTIITNQELVQEMIDKYPETYYRPNQRYHYSNTGYALLAAIVEKVSGLTFNDYLKKFVFDPLQMNSSFTFLDKQHFDSITATGYLKYNKVAEDNYLDFVLGDKGVYCSALDLFKWDQGLYFNKIIHPDTLAIGFKPMGKPEYFYSNYGYGWRMFHWGPDSTKVLFHAGWWHGFRSILMRIPEDSTSIIVLKNRSYGSSVSTKSLLNIFYPKTIAADTTIISE